MFTSTALEEFRKGQLNKCFTRKSFCRMPDLFDTNLHYFALLIGVCCKKRYILHYANCFVYSSELTNSLCYALEAVFLHGLIGATTDKVSSYVSTVFVYFSSRWK